MLGKKSERNKKQKNRNVYIKTKYRLFVCTHVYSAYT